VQAVVAPTATASRVLARIGYPGASYASVARAVDEELPGPSSYDFAWRAHHVLEQHGRSLCAPRRRPSAGAVRSTTRALSAESGKIRRRGWLAGPKGNPLSMHEPRHEPSAKGRGRPWLLPLVAALGMLVLPTLAWFLFPQGDEPISVRTVGGAVVPAAPPAEQESAPLDVPTKGGRVIVGVVRDTDENNVEGASVYVERAPALRGATDESGRFRLRNAPTSGFVLVATKAGYVTGRATVSEGEPGSEVSVEVVLGGRGGVRGRVLGPDGKPTPGAFVTCTADGRTFQGRTNAEGASSSIPSPRAAAPSPSCRRSGPPVR
jgi:hypothetical protein